jgi:hypothetical protein
VVHQVQLVHVVALAGGGVEADLLAAGRLERRAGGGLVGGVVLDDHGGDGQEREGAGGALADLPGVVGAGGRSGGDGVGESGAEAGDERGGHVLAVEEGRAASIRSTPYAPVSCLHVQVTELPPE